MTSHDDAIEQLSRALDRTRAIISGVRPDQIERPTPCTEWNVGELVNHVVQDLHRFTARASGVEGKKPDQTDEGDDGVGAYENAADALLQAWRSDGALDRTVKLPFGPVPARWFVGQHLADIVVHGWDLAMATGQPTEFDPDLVQTALEWARQNLRPELRGDSFGAEVPVPDDAPIEDRLVGFFGRDPAWSGAG